MKRALIALSLMVLPMAAIADIGIGASFKSNEAGIYLPITITPRVFVEPYFRYNYRDTESTLSGGAESNSDSSFTSLSVGAGIFGVSKLGDAVDFYYGARAAYLRQESSSTFLLINSVPNPSFALPTQEFDADGFSIAPTIGFQYFLTDRLSLGAEARWEFSELSGTSTNTGTAGTETRIDQKTRQSDTRTDILLRFYFK